MQIQNLPKNTLRVWKWLKKGQIMFFCSCSKQKEMKRRGENRFNTFVSETFLCFQENSSFEVLR